MAQKRQQNLQKKNLPDLPATNLPSSGRGVQTLTLHRNAAKKLPPVGFASIRTRSLQIVKHNEIIKIIMCSAGSAQS